MHQSPVPTFVPTSGESAPETPESAVPESAVPESAVPESAVPESAVPESAVPESAVPESAVPESAVMVSMCGDSLVICPPRRVDLETTRVLVAAAAAAVQAGATVMIDLDPDTASDDLVPLGPVPRPGEHPVLSEGGPVRVLGAGSIRLSTHDSHWTIDLSESRLFRADTTIDPWFVGPDGWTQIRAIWATCTLVTALTVDGSYLSTRTAWAPHDAPTGAVHAMS